MAMGSEMMLCRLGIFLGVLLVAPSASAWTISFSSDDFTVSPTFSSVTNFSFLIDINAPLTPGSYINPAINNIEYEVQGMLVPGTPSGFPAFFLQRNITGSEFYNQGSSLRFEISNTADLSDGLQVSELTGTDPVFVFDGREIDNGRFHPALLQLNSNGTGSIRNSNNIISLDPLNQIDFGDEYISDLAFIPDELTLAEAQVPEPLTILGAGTAVGFGAFFKRELNKSKKKQKDSELA